MMKKLLIALPFLLVSCCVFAQTEQTIDQFWPQLQADVEANGISAVAAVMHNGNELDELNELDEAFTDKLTTSILNTHYAELNCSEIDSDPFQYLDEFEVTYHAIPNDEILDDGRVYKKSVLLTFGRIEGKYKLFLVQIVPGG